MVKRLLWLGVGVAVGIVVVRKLAQTADAVSPSGIAGRLRDSAVTAGESFRSFMADVSEGMAMKEAELYDAIAEGRPVGELLEDPDEEYHDSGEGGTIR